MLSKQVNLKLFILYLHSGSKEQQESSSRFLSLCSSSVTLKLLLCCCCFARQRVYVPPSRLTTSIYSYQLIFRGISWKVSREHVVLAGPRTQNRAQSFRQHIHWWLNWISNVIIKVATRASFRISLLGKKAHTVYSLLPL